MGRWIGIHHCRTVEGIDVVVAISLTYLPPQAPTKKERAEAQKATARIKADTQASIPRSEKHLTLGNLFSKFACVHFVPCSLMHHAHYGPYFTTIFLSQRDDDSTRPCDHHCAQRARVLHPSVRARHTTSITNMTRLRRIGTRPINAASPTPSYPLLSSGPPRSDRQPLPKASHPRTPFKSSAPRSVGRPIAMSLPR